MEKEELEILKEINDSLKKMNLREETNELFSSSEKTFDKIERRAEHSTYQIQNSFDRIHDKIFNLNNLLIAVYLVLSTFPSNKPIMKLWLIIFPVLNMVYMIIIDYRQMEIHRYAANEMNWTPEQQVEFGKKISKQTLISFSSILTTFLCLIILIISLLLTF